MTLRSLVEDRIKNTITDFRDISGASDLRTLLASAVTPPGCYIYREKATVKPNAMLNKVVQQKTEYIGLIVVTRNVRDARGGINADESEQLCDLIETQLLGYEPSQDFSPLEYAGGDLVLMRDGLHFWREVYKSDRTIRST
ncbi:MAG: hypothetical protein M0R47_15855 [Methylobacter sp.]|uniref:phage tail terminator protein n=1 Tax=Methylobacter sp. TaxID=2051955 RepID=UPI0026007CAC|nr:hypothetical protein [Methylobacter sp.]MCK9621995.1 hypothetical protein [Methylobacter sp.]